jgi:Phage portal protein, SPP1 Gp6-like
VINFYPPSYRAAASDLTVAVSPLGLVELADEEFEVHGPRMNRYASNWAFFLGHHWAYKREVGDQNITVNYCRMLIDYLNNFCFSKGVNFGSPEATEAIVPYLLKKVWEEDNDRLSVIMELAQLGSVSGDVFCKVAYEPAYQNPTTGEQVSSKFKILPINPAFCFPEFHPHDKTRFIKFKMKYKFWGTAADGTRQVHTYTELMTDDMIEEYINDEMIDQRPNPLGRIPVAYIPNYPVASSPWGLGDINDLVGLNREYNEKATEISDIINYHAAPVTVITGAKASNLERGPKKVWGIPNKDAKIQNLQLEGNLQGPLGYMEMIKTAMHETIGVPMGSLGQAQPISNTSGVALHMQYLPLMLRHQQKKVQYTKLFLQINELVMRTIAFYEPQFLAFDFMVSPVPPKPTQYQALDPADPVTFQTTVKWPSPLPLDNLILINELQAKIQLGMESKRGALDSFGEAFPDQKLQEVFDETIEDLKQQGAAQLTTAGINQFIIAATGMAPDGSPLIIPGAGGVDAEGNEIPPTVPEVDPMLAQEIMMIAAAQYPAARNDFEE